MRSHVKSPLAATNGLFVGIFRRYKRAETRLLGRFGLQGKLLSRVKSSSLLELKLLKARKPVMTYSIAIEGEPLSIL